MKLVERYALATGLKIGKQHLLENFFALPFTRYITLHASSGMLGKNYPYYLEVVLLLKPYLAPLGIEIVQMGGKEDVPIPGCHHTMGKDSMAQGSYLVSKAMLHLGNDSVWGHRAGYLGIPLVQPWGTTSPANHSSYEADPAKTIHLVSHRFGRNPTFAAQENPSTIALIDPYDVARAVLKLLGIEHTLIQHAHYIGPMYPNPVIEWVPDAVVNPQFNPEMPLVARMDKFHDENALIQVLQGGRKIHLFAKQPIQNLGIFQHFKDQLMSYSHEVNAECPATYVRTVKTQYPKVSFFSRLPEGEALNALRFQFLDHTFIEQATEPTRADYVKKSAEYLNEPAEKTLDRMSQVSTLEYKTNKYILSKNQIYSSYAALRLGQPHVEGKASTVIDDPEFWADLNHLFLHTP